MSFKIKKLYNIESDILINVDQVADDLTLINIQLKSSALFLDSRPFHYRYDFGDFPPLDISFDTETGLLKEITTFIDLQNINCKCQQPEMVAHMSGYPCVDIELHKQCNYLHDVKCIIQVALDSGTLIMQQQGKVTHNILLINEHLKFLLDEKLVFIGLEVDNIAM